MVWIRMAGGQRRPRERAVLHAAREKRRRFPDSDLQLYARGSRELSNRSSPPRLLSRDLQFRLNLLWRHGRRQFGRRSRRTISVERPALFDQAAPAAPRRGVFQIATRLISPASAPNSTGRCTIHRSGAKGQIRDAWQCLTWAGTLSLWLAEPSPGPSRPKSSRIAAFAWPSSNRTSAPTGKSRTVCRAGTSNSANRNTAALTRD